MREPSSSPHPYQRPLVFWASHFLHPLDLIPALPVCRTRASDGESDEVWSRWRHLLWHRLPATRSAFVAHLRLVVRLHEQWTAYCGELCGGMNRGARHVLLRTSVMLDEHDGLHLAKGAVQTRVEAWDR